MKHITVKLTEDQLQEIVTCLIERSEEMADLGRSEKEIAFVTRLNSKLMTKLAKAKTV